MTEVTGSAPAGNPAPAANTAATAASAAVITAETVTAAPNPTIDWLPNADPETAAFVKNKGWSDPNAAINSYRNLEKLLGADRAGRTVELPGEGADEATLNQFYERIGRPKSAADYKIEIPPENGDPAFADWAKGVFHKHGIPAKAAEGIAQEWNKYMGGKSMEMSQAFQQKLAEEQTALKGEWGAAWDRNTNLARAAVQQLGLGADEVTAIEQSLGFAKTMKLFQQLGSKVGEDKFVGADSRSSAGDGAMSPAEAKLELDRLMADKEFVAAWRDKWHPGHQAAIAKKSRLSAFMAGGAA